MNEIECNYAHISHSEMHFDPYFSSIKYEISQFKIPTIQSVALYLLYFQRYALKTCKYWRPESQIPRTLESRTRFTFCDIILYHLVSACIIKHLTPPGDFTGTSCVGTPLPHAMLLVGYTETTLRVKARFSNGIYSDVFTFYIDTSN